MNVLVAWMVLSPVLALLLGRAIRSNATNPQPHRARPAHANVGPPQHQQETPMTDPTAYERLQQAAAAANQGARVLAMDTLRNVHRECAALENEWRDRQDPGADDVRAVLARIRVKLDPAVKAPEPLEDRARRLVDHLFNDGADGSSR